MVHPDRDSIIGTPISITKVRASLVKSYIKPVAVTVFMNISRAVITRKISTLVPLTGCPKTNPKYFL